jgi:ferredoxin
MMVLLSHPLTFHTAYSERCGLSQRLAICHAMTLKGAPELKNQMRRANTSLRETIALDGSIHVVVDLNRCQAYAQCCFLAPDVFRLHGEEALWYDPAPAEAQREHVLRAAAACPVQAIFVEWAGAANQQKAEEPHA